MRPTGAPGRTRGGGQHPYQPGRGEAPDPGDGAAGEAVAGDLVTDLHLRDVRTSPTDRRPPRLRA